VCGVARADGRRALVPRQPGELQLGEAPLAGDAVHDVELRGRAGSRAQQPLAPGARFVPVAGLEERHQRERGVAQPAVAIIPVSHAAEALGQRRRRRGHEPARRRKGQGLERDERSKHVGVPRTRVPALLGPGGPVPVCALQGLVGVERTRRLEVRRTPGEIEGQALAGANGEGRDRPVILARQRDRREQAQPVRACDRFDAAVDLLDPRHDRSVVGPQNELEPQAHFAPRALDDADDVGDLAVERHEVGDGDRAAVGLELRFQHERAVAVPPPARP